MRVLGCLKVSDMLQLVVTDQKRTLILIGQPDSIGFAKFSRDKLRASCKITTQSSECTLEYFQVGKVDPVPAGID